MLLRETRRRSSEQKCEKTCLGCASPKGTHRRDVLRVKRLAQCRPAIVEGVDLFERLVIYCLESGIVIQDGQGRRSSTSFKMHVPIFGVEQEHRSQEDGLLSENRMIVARNRSCEPFVCRTTTAAPPTSDEIILNLFISERRRKLPTGPHIGRGVLHCSDRGLETVYDQNRVNPGRPFSKASNTSRIWPTVLCLRIPIPRSPASSEFYTLLSQTNHCQRYPVPSFPSRRVNLPTLGLFSSSEINQLMSSCPR